MKTALVILLTAVSIVGLYTAYWFQMELNPTFPIVPLGLAFVCGVAMRQAFGGDL
jgi:hypothetical protein